MQIELIGSTSVGKSTLAKYIQLAGQEQKIEIVLGQDYVLKLSHLHWITNDPVRKMVIYIVAFMSCLLTVRKNIDFFQFVYAVINRLSSVSWQERVRIARLVCRNLGVYEIIERFSSETEIVLVDEGILHIVHYLFVHVSLEPDLNAISAYLEISPFPELVAYVKADQDLVIERLLIRGHRRIPGDKREATKSFVKHAQQAFDYYVEKLTSAGVPIIKIDEEEKIQVVNENKFVPNINEVLELVRAGLNAMKAESRNSTGRTHHGSLSIAA